MSSTAFPDGYDIERERRELHDMLDGDPDPHDPRQPRFLELLRREDELRQRETPTVRETPGAIARDRESADIQAMQALRPAAADAMHLHTRDAYRLFLGSAGDSAGRRWPIYGARMAAWALRMLWTLSLRDNPFADWALVNLDDDLAQTSSFLRQQTDTLRTRLAALRERGYEVSVLAAAQTQRTELQFSSPYAFAVMNLVVDFDYLVRLVRTLGRRDDMSDHEVDEAIGAVRHRLRALIVRIVQFNSVLNNDAVRHCTRADFLPQADPAARRRVRTLTGIYGEIPAPVLSGEKRPRHGQRIRTASRSALTGDAESAPDRAGAGQNGDGGLL